MSEIQENKTKNNGGLMLVLIALIIALGVLAYSWSNKNKALNECSNSNKELEADMEGMNQMMSGYVGNMSNDLRKDFQKMLATYDALKTKDSTQSENIQKQKEKIQSLLNELNTGKKLSAKQIYALNKENETLRGIMKGYVKQIDSLNTLNLKLSTELDNKTQELHTTVNERNQYKNQAEESAAQVKKGARLQALGFNSGALRMKLNNTTESTNKARNAIQVKSGFTITANPLTRPGMKTFYMQITSPEGIVLQARENNIIQTDGGSVAYSDKKAVDYNNDNLDVVIYYNLKEGEATKGNYTVKIFCEGQVVGTDSFTLK
jgi:chemotaxis protein CheY-P-specific phosphatase CheC